MAGVGDEDLKKMGWWASLRQSALHQYPINARLVPTKACHVVFSPELLLFSFDELNNFG